MSDMVSDTRSDIGSSVVGVSDGRLRRCWIVLTTGNRPAELAAAVASIERVDPDGDIVVVGNGVDVAPVGRATVHRLDENLGVPGGRQAAVDLTDADLCYFLDDDARVLDLDVASIDEAFRDDPTLVGMSFRLVDEHGDTARRHVPRLGRRRALTGGDVATFLGGASVLRRSAVDGAGGYWTELFYGHEELELAWRMIDRGGRIRYEPAVVVFHPATSISRHAHGWRLTGRNRVRIARRDLPWPVAIVHVTVWLVAGLVRTPDSATRRAYLGGWWSGWSGPVDRAPISWRTVVRLSALGRPPIV